MNKNIVLPNMVDIFVNKKFEWWAVYNPTAMAIAKTVPLISGIHRTVCCCTERKMPTTTITIPNTNNKIMLSSSGS